MTGYNKIFFDTAPLIYYLEGELKFGNKVDMLMKNNAEAEFVTSTITVGEYLTLPFLDKEINCILL